MREFICFPWFGHDGTATIAGAISALQHLDVIEGAEADCLTLSARRLPRRSGQIRRDRTTADHMLEVGWQPHTKGWRLAKFAHGMDV
jgi:hypothetical protein